MEYDAWDDEKESADIADEIWSAALRTLGILIAVYGVYGFIKRDIGLYMTLQNMFVFFDFEEPLVFFILDYLAVMGLFAWVGYYVAEWLKRFSIRKIKESINRRKSL